MDKNKQKRLEKKGWEFGSADDFLRLTPEETTFLDLKIKLSDTLKLLRKKYNFTQVQLAKQIHSSQSRVAKMEVGDPTVSLDLIIRALLVLGTTKKELASAISSA